MSGNWDQKVKSKDSVDSGYAGIPWTINAELFSLEAKDFTASFTYCLNWSLTFVLTLVYQDLSLLIYPYGTYFLFGTVCIFGEFTKGYKNSNR